MIKDQTKHTIEEAIKLAKESCTAKFDSTVELHINLGIDPKKPDQNIRFTTTLPHGTGKEVKVAVFASKEVKEADIQLSESDLDKIEKGQIKPNIDFHVLVCEPRYMAKLAKVARILGPQGVMPNPKAGTVTEDVEKAVQQIKKGKIEIRNEQNAPIIHTIAGKKSFDDKKIQENVKEIIASIKQNRPQKVRIENLFVSLFISCTMGKSFAIELD